MITISLCMIVKNEEENLGRCLKSLQGIVDEMIVVDTGSEDKTVEIAREFGAKVYDFKWTGDFSEARNYSFSLASCDYIYAADADEELDEDNRQRFIQLKKDIEELDIDIVQMYYCNQLSFRTVYNYDRELRPKLFRRVRSFRWEDPIHEQVVIEPVICNSEVEIIHRPKESHAQRDLASFRRAVESGRRISKRLHGMYARELFMGGDDDDFLKAKRFFAEAVKDSTRSVDEVKDAATEMCSEMCCELGDYYYGKEDYDEAIVWYYNAAYECSSILDIKKSKEFPRLALAKCYKALGNEEQAEDYEKEAAEIEKGE